MKTLDQIDNAELKEMCKALNALPIIDPKVRTIGVKKDAMLEEFRKAVLKVPEAEEGNIPPEIITFFNDCFQKSATDGTTETAKPAEEKKAGAAAKKEKPAAAPAKKEKPIKAPADPKKVASMNAARAKKDANASTAKSCFGHKLGTQSALLDDLIQEGKSTLEQLIEKSGRGALGVKGHITHLIKERGLKVVTEEKTGIVKVTK